ncbi:major capsid family protein, partial [Enterobacter bugandensis]
NVGVNYREETGKVFSLGNFYEYSLMEIRASQATGKNLPTRLANAARRAHDVKVNDLAFYGDDDYQIVGVLDHPNIPVTTSAGWTTGEIASGELEDAVSAIETVTKGLHSANVIALPPSAFKILSKPMPNTNTSYMTYFNTQYPGMQWIRV